MKKKSTSRSAFLNPRVLFGAVMFSASLLLALLAMANQQRLIRDHVGHPDTQVPGPNSVLFGSSFSVRQAWVAPYTGVFDDEATGIAVDRLGNVYVTGFSGAPDYYAYVTIKYNASGQEEWTAAYADPNSINFATAIAVDNSGNVYVTGVSGSFDSGNDDYATIKYNSAGEEQWVARYDGPASGNDGATAIAVDDSGSVYVTGSSFGSGTDVDYATIKYDSSGQQQWVARYNGPANGGDDAVAIAVDSSHNVYVTGFSLGAGTSQDYATIKYDSSGQQQWVARCNGSGNGFDEATAIAIDGLGDVYVTGGSPGSDGITAYATIKYNAAGQEQWVARYNGPGTGSNEASAVGLDSAGNIYVTGSSFGVNGTYDYATIKYNAVGQEQWVSRYHGPGDLDDFAIAMAVNSSGDVYVTGESSGDYATIRYNSSGQEQWVARYNGPENFDDYATAIAVDRLGNVYVTGATHQSDVYYDYDFATIKYTQPRPLPTPLPRPTPPR
jgi:uncharacterized delta-60 repeat protein